MGTVGVPLVNKMKSPFCNILGMRIESFDLSAILTGNVLFHIFKSFLFFPPLIYQSKIYFHILRLVMNVLKKTNDQDMYRESFGK